MDKNSGYKVFVNVAGDAESEEGQELIHKLLGTDDVKSFPFSISKGPARTPDSHTVDCVVYIVSGELEIGFGEEFSDKVKVGRGDFLYIKRDTPHREQAGGDEDVELNIYYTGNFGVKGV